jgi:Protein of unknown function (DUF1353)
VSYGFTNTLAEVATSDGRNFIVRQPIEYLARDGTRYQVAIGALTDGMSTPQQVWAIIPPFGLTTWLPAVLHDAAYRLTLKIWAAGRWCETALVREDCDRLILEAMESLGADPAKRDVIYEALRLFGQAAFDEDRGKAAAATSPGQYAA